VIRHGHPWSVLWAALFLLLFALFQAETHFTRLVVVLAFIGVGWVALRGSAYLQAAVAVGLVWWMLIGGTWWAASGFRFPGGTSDANQLGDATLIPRFMWDLLFASIGIVALCIGGHELLRR
jgi:Peptidase M50B-like